MTWPADSPFLDVIRLDINPDVRDGCLDWLDNEWLPQLAKTRKAVSASRYRCIYGEPRELIFIGSLRANAGEPVATLPTGNSLIGRWMRNYETATYRQVFSQGPSIPEYTYINAITTRVRSAAARQFTDWYSGVHMPEILKCPGWQCGRRYERSDFTSEFLAVYQVTDVDTPFQSPQYEKAVGWDGFDEVMLGFHGFRIFELQNSLTFTKDPVQGI